MSGLTLLSCSTTLWIITKLVAYIICFLILNEKKSPHTLMKLPFLHLYKNDCKFQGGLRGIRNPPANESLLVAPPSTFVPGIVPCQLFTATLSSDEFSTWFFIVFFTAT